MSVTHYNPRTLPSPPGHLLNLAALWASCDVYANMSSLGSVQPQMCIIWKRYISNMFESSFFSFLSFRDGELNAGSVGHRSEPHKLAGTHTAQQGLRCRVPSHFLAHQDLLFGPHLLSRLGKAQQYCKTSQFWTCPWFWIQRYIVMTIQNWENLSSRASWLFVDRNQLKRWFGFGWIYPTTCFLLNPSCVCGLLLVQSRV